MATAPDTLLYSWSPGEARLALAAQGRVEAFHLIRAGRVAGGIWLGRVTGLNKALNAAFVELGEGPAGLLPDPKGLTEGQAVLVQARAEAWSGKGPKLTAEASLAGRLVAWSPFRPGLNASRKLPEPERQRLLALARELTGPAEGLVIRTQAEGADPEALAAEIDSLRSRWRAIEAAAASAKAPACLYRPDPVEALLGDHPSLTRLVVDDAAAHAELRARWGAGLEVELHRGDAFDLCEAHDDWERALAAEITLPGGGSIVIEPTAALTAIDVNSGAGPAEAANAEAVAEIARQLRLRNLGGAIAIDLIPVRQKGHLSQMAERLRRALAADPVPTHLMGLSNLGLIELTRERRGASLMDLMAERDSRPTAEALACEALRQAARLGRPAVLTAHPEVIAALPVPALAELDRRLGGPLRRKADPSRAREDFHLQ